MRRILSLCVSHGKGNLGCLNEQILLREQHFRLSCETIHHKETILWKMGKEQLWKEHSGDETAGAFSCRSILSPILGINFSVLSYQNFYSCFQKNDKINYSPSFSLGSPFAGGVNEQWIGHKTGRNIRKKSRQFR